MSNNQHPYPLKFPRTKYLLFLGGDKIRVQLKECSCSCIQTSLHYKRIEQFWCKAEQNKLDVAPNCNIFEHVWNGEGMKEGSRIQSKQRMNFINSYWALRMMDTEHQVSKRTRKWRGKKGGIIKTMCVVERSVNMATRTQIIKCIVVLLIQCPDISINKVFPLALSILRNPSLELGQLSFSFWQPNTLAFLLF